MHNKFVNCWRCIQFTSFLTQKIEKKANVWKTDMKQWKWLTHSTPYTTTQSSSWLSTNLILMSALKNVLGNWVIFKWLERHDYQYGQKYHDQIILYYDINHFGLKNSLFVAPYMKPSIECTWSKENEAVFTRHMFQ